MFDLYTFLKWGHVFFITIAFGSNITHFIWLLTAQKNPDHYSHTVRLVKKIDDWMAVPSYVIAGACGIAMWLWAWPTYESWIVVSVVMFTALSLWGITFDKPMKRWIKMAAELPPHDPTLTAHAEKLTKGWAGITFCAFIILVLMVWKPTFW